jgi:hypothetical protein
MGSFRTGRRGGYIYPFSFSGNIMNGMNVQLANLVSIEI